MKSMSKAKAVSLAPIVTALAVAGLAGCTTTASMQSQVTERVQARVNAPLPAAVPVVRTVTKLVPRGTEVDDVDERTAVTINMQNAPAVQVIREIAGRMGFGVTAATGVEVTRRVTVDIRGLTPHQAMRQVAWQAGYALVVNDSERQVTIANEATTVFRIPSEDLRRMMNTTFSYGGSPIAGSSPGGGGGAAPGGAAPGAPGGGSGGGSTFNPIRADVTVQGQLANSPQAFTRFIESLAGANATAQVYFESGMVAVRGNGQAIKRVHDFLARYAYDMRRQVEINARIVEVSLNNDFRYGIQWDRVFNAAGTRQFTLDTLGAGRVGTAADAAATMTVRGTNPSAIIRALESFTQVDVTAQPRMTISNGSTGVIFEGRQVPFLPSVTQTTTGAGGTAQVTRTGSAALAVDGTNLAVHANILDDDNAVLTIVPSTVTLGNQRTFLDGTITMFEQFVKSGGQRLNVSSGQTIVMSGNQFTRDNGTRTGLPGVVNVPVLGTAASGSTAQREVRETVLLINAVLVRPNSMSIVFSESL